MRNRVVLVIFLLALFVGSYLRARDLLLPYENGHRGATAAFFALMAKNHLRYGFQTTGGVCVVNPGRVDREHLHYYLHHPPGTIWIATLGAALGGTTPAGLRLVFLPFSIGVILLVYRLGRSRGRRIAAAAAAIAAMVPIATYYGAFVNFELPTLFFSLLALHLFERYRRRGRRRDHARCLFAFAAAVFCDWIAFGIPICLWILTRLARAEDRAKTPDHVGHAPLRARRLVPQLFGAGVAVVIAVKVLYAIQTARFGIDPDAAAGIGYYLQVTPFAATFDLDTFWTKISLYLNTWYGSVRLAASGNSVAISPLICLAAIGLIPVAFRAVKRRLDSLDITALTILAMGTANLAVLANHATVHDYYVFYLFPAVALLSAGLLAYLPSAGKARFAFPIVLIALLGHLYVEGEDAHDTRTVTLLADNGERIKKHTNQEDVVILPHYFTLQVSVTADRLILNAKDTTEFAQALQRATDLGHTGRPVVFLVDKAASADLDPALVRELEQRSKGPKEERGPFLAYDLGVL